MLEIDVIRVEHQLAVLDAADIVITDEKQPRIAFSVTSDRQGCKIKMATVEINGWKADMPDQLGIAYGGEPLEPLTEYRGTVAVEDSFGETDRREFRFRTGRLDLPWQAKWITDGSYSFESPEPPVPMRFRRIFTAEKPIRRLRVMATAMGIFDMYLDGARIHGDYFNPGFTDYDANLQYVTYELNALPAGEHVFSAVVAGGWAVGRSTHVDDTTKSESKLDADRQALLAELRLEYADGSEAIIGTDEAFEVTEDGPCRFADFYDGETWDATFDENDAVWRKATEEALRVRPQISARYGLPVRAREPLAPVAWMEAPSGELICDFGQNIAGVLSMRVRGVRGQAVIIRHAEALEHGELYVQNLRSAKQTLRYICKDGEQAYSPRFTYMGFRYVGIRGIERKDIELTAVPVCSALETAGGFRCSNEDLNQLQSNLRWSGLDNFVDIPTDCPQRDERQGWTGDIALFAPTACFNFDMNRFLEKWLTDMRSEQDENGALPFVIPARRGITPAMTTSCWSDSCILVPWALYRASGDRSVLEKQYPTMKLFLEDAARWARMSEGEYGTPHILKHPFQFGDWCAPYGSVPDWLAKGPWVGTAYYAHSCKLMSRIAAILGKDEDCRRYAELSEAIKAVFITCFTDGNGHLNDEFQTGYVLPLVFDLVDGEARHTMVERLWKLIEENGVHLSTGFTATPFILFALADNGYEKEAYQLLMQDGDPSWLYQVRHGATTLWEGWSSIQPDGSIRESSLNHYAYGSVGDFLYRRVCGLEATEPGYRRFTVRPVPGGDLTFAECEHRCPFGLIRARWERDDGQLRLTVSVPVGTECEAVLPDGSVHNVGSGEYTFVCRI